MEVVITGKQIATYLTIGIPLLVAIFAGVYKVGLDVNAANLKHKEDLVKEYERSSQLDAPGLVSSLNQSAEALVLSSHERKAFDVARNRVDEYAAKLGGYEADLAERGEKITQLTERLAQSEAQYEIKIKKLKSELESYLMPSSTLTAEKGTATELIPNHAMLGVQSVYGERAVFKFDGSDIYLDVGQSYSIKADEISCVLWLTKVFPKDDKVELKLVCAR
ncbi:hypothetical protein ACP43V_07280 [Vibrio genomosp. F10 str. 9ZC157]|uniref:hypothetical protein n=1 Tax=Vibrio genomosp. F10 TaxID=723171 RepID=UPI00030A05E1|nr:hypothetical protein [Vibrio genomosp. F10]OEE96367.1 hypothetical protein A1QM_16995 [Vibrio genomosp. F10 str. 9ZC157]